MRTKKIVDVSSSLDVKEFARSELILSAVLVLASVPEGSVKRGAREGQQMFKRQQKTAKKVTEIISKRGNEEN